MSYDIYLRKLPSPCPTCGHEAPAPAPDLPDPTYNLTPIFDLALTGEPLPNSNVSEAQIRVALEKLNDPAHRSAFRALEPSNGWGTTKDAIYVMERLLTAAMSYPDSTWEIR